MCLGVKINFLSWKQAVEETSKISAVRYSSIAAKHTPDRADILYEYIPFLRRRFIRLGGNIIPALYYFGYLFNFSSSEFADFWAFRGI